jgi:uncharacterized protein
MPRPRKWRRVCLLPQVNTFGPINDSKDVEYIYMTVEEYETIRLMDLEGLNQEESANRMGVARSTIQRIYDGARKKLADSLVNGKVLKIEGGSYKLCSELEDRKQCDRCIRHRHRGGKYEY